MRSSSIRLIECTESIFRTILAGDDIIAQNLNINVIPEWTEFGTPAFQYGLNSVLANPNTQKWWTYLPIHTASNTLIGSCGFKGPPTDHQVEIGYEVAKPFRNQGYATVIVKLLIIIALQDKNVKKIIAHTLAEKNASTQVLTKCKFKQVEEIQDLEDGLIWKWELPV